VVLHGNKISHGEKLPIFTLNYLYSNFYLYKHEDTIWDMIA
jgi:hypothetical protein